LRTVDPSDDPSAGILGRKGSTLDEATRPRLPKRTDAAPTPSGRVGQRTLVAVHQHLRSELAQIRQVVDDVAANVVSAAQARDLVQRTSMRQNYWTLGAFCAAYCRVVSVHHTIEDQRLFPDLRSADGSLAPVLDRLSAEHELIAGMLDEVDRALVDLIGGRCEPDAVRAVVDRLSTVMLSHLAYEEEELLEPIGQLSIVV
jgi:hemerythrin-like domain-containing protein